MRRSLALVALLSIALFCVPAALARPADLPEPGNATIPTHVLLVGCSGGVADPAGEFTVVNRDLANNPIPNSNITCDFSGCFDLRIAAVQPFPGLRVDCATRTVSALTDATGTARFRIVGGANNPGGAPGAGFNAMRVCVDGILFAYVNAAAVDQNSFNGVDANDLAAFVTDVLNGLAVGRSDYDGSGAVGPNDLAVWIKFFMGAGSVQGAASLPGGTCP